MANELQVQEAEIVSSLPVRQRDSVVLVPVMDVATAKAKLKEFQEFCAHYLDESKDGGADGGDFGVIPGTKKSTLLKSGADKLAEIYGMYDDYEVVSSVEDWDRGLFDYTLKCVLRSRRDDSMIGSGVGSCSSWESKYRWRDAKRLCPQCGKPTIIKGQAQYGGGFICWKKEGRSDGCGAKFAEDAKAILDQPIGRMENPDIIDTKNTVLKMAKKRAKIDAVIAVTRSSGIFTQDFDDIAMPAPRPNPAVTKEDIEIGSARNVTGSEATKGASVVTPMAASDKKRETSGEAPASEAEVVRQLQKDGYNATVSGEDAKPEFEGCIDKPRQIAFARAWAGACPVGIDKETARHQWLARHNYVDKDGIPTSAKIPLAIYEDEKRDAVNFARKLK